MIVQEKIKTIVIDKFLETCQRRKFSISIDKINTVTSLFDLAAVRLAINEQIQRGLLVANLQSEKEGQELSLYLCKVHERRLRDIARKYALLIIKRSRLHQRRTHFVRGRDLHFRIKKIRPLEFREMAYACQLDLKKEAGSLCDIYPCMETGAIRGSFQSEFRRDRHSTK